jgi:hypothetical protein
MGFADTEDVDAGEWIDVIESDAPELCRRITTQSVA